MFKSKLEQMEIAYNINDAKKVYQEVDSIRKGLLSRTLLIRDKEGNIKKQERESPAEVFGIL